MSQAQTESKNVPAQDQQKKQRSTVFRVETQKRIEINKTHNDRRQRAQVMKIITIGLFGRKRFENIYLTSSLNNFYHALMIANTLQKKVERLALVINMQKIKYTEFADQKAQGQQKEYSIFVIKITRNPTEEDKKNIGYNQGLQKIQNPLTEIMKTKFNRNNRNFKGRRGGNRGDQRRGDRNDRRTTERTTERRNQNNKDQRRPQRETGERRQYQRRDNRQRDRRDNRDNRYFKEQRDNRQTKRYQSKYQGQRDTRRNDRQDDRGDRRDQRSYNKNNEGPYNRRYGNNQRRDQQPRRYRQDKYERVQDQQFRRGQRKTRGTNGGQHNYNKEHLNRVQDRAERNPRKNRYQSDQEN